MVCSVQQHNIKRNIRYRRVKSSTERSLTRSHESTVCVLSSQRSSSLHLYPPCEGVLSLFTTSITLQKLLNIFDSERIPSSLLITAHAVTTLTADDFGDECAKIELSALARFWFYFCGDVGNIQGRLLPRKNRGRIYQLFIRWFTVGVMQRCI